MTQKEKRIKLAESMGIKHGVKCATTDYFNDLNAVHELWLSLPRVSRMLVVANLADMIGLPKGEEAEIGELEEALFSATAAQRAEAIGKTLNLW